jgi:hypothetical protein
MLQFAGEIAGGACTPANTDFDVPRYGYDGSKWSNKPLHTMATMPGAPSNCGKRTNSSLSRGTCVYSRKECRDLTKLRGSVPGRDPSRSRDLREDRA